MQCERIDRGLSQSEGARSSHGKRGAHDSDSAGLGGRDAKKVADDVVGDHQQEDDEEGDDERRVLATDCQQRSGKRDRRSLSRSDAPEESAKLEVRLKTARHANTRQWRRGWRRKSIDLVQGKHLAGSGAARE
jgi:hypothetical protein